MIFFFIFSLLFFHPLQTFACSKSILPNIDIKLWAGDALREGITRSQDSKTIRASENLFDDFVSMTYDDYKYLMQTMASCKEWGTLPNPPTPFVDPFPALHENSYMKVRSTHNHDTQALRKVLLTE